MASCFTVGYRRVPYQTGVVLTHLSSPSQAMTHTHISTVHLHFVFVSSKHDYRKEAPILDTMGKRKITRGFLSHCSGII